ncbi:MAG: mannitol-1-phosphate 5-dehydrogenase [Treponema sp.]|jgi:mannitol-1-phosphate 5-dehydrogenase|nr:mannitol-1-phosphate 5-dehydrogenase [Treponema sp.]
MMKLVQIGAGNIGRSFTGAIFSRAGWEVVFADVSQSLVSLLNERRYYTVVIKREGREDELRRIGPVRACDMRDRESVTAEIAGCDLLSVSVGKDALPFIMAPVAAALEKRQRINGKPLDIIIAENVPGAKRLFAAGLQAALKDTAFRIEDIAGLVETSIGKMVPLVTQEDRAADPLRLFAEEYETLIADKKAFHGGPPVVPGLAAVDNITAWVQRKLYIHNLGHAAAAYWGYQADPRVRTICGVLALPGIEDAVRASMCSSAGALVREYPETFTTEELRAHIDDLLFRFKNSALGDTVFRVGQDLPRKLSGDDRIVGAMLLCARRGVAFEAAAAVYRAALEFRAAGDDGRLFPADEFFLRETLAGRTAQQALESADFMAAVSGLNESDVEKKKVLETLRQTEPGYGPDIRK